MDPASPSTPRSHPLAPAHALMFRSFGRELDQTALFATLSRALRLPESDLRPLLQNPPVRLLVSSDAQKIQEQQDHLSRLGCVTSLEPAWRYKHWTLPETLLERFAHSQKKHEAWVASLLQVHPAPGFLRLQGCVQKLAQAGAYPLNHGQILLEMPRPEELGAGEWLRSTHKALADCLCPRDALGRPAKGAQEYRLFSALALRGEDGEELQAILDVLQERLSGQGAVVPRASEADANLAVLERPVAGEAWARLLRFGSPPASGETLSISGQDYLLAHWPLQAPDATLQDDPHLLERQERILDAYAKDSDQRVQRCQRLLRQFDSVEHLPSLPQLALQVYRLAQQGDSETEELSRLVRSDPALSARILSIVNSTFYGLRQKVDSVSHALVILGFDEVSQLALMLSSEKLFANLGAERGHRMWRHCAMTADIARALARRLDMPASASIYTAALLHDAGRVFLYVVEPGLMEELETKAQEHKLPLYEMERACFAHDHATLGAALLRRWSLPESICEAVAQHHGPLPGHKGISETAALIGLADDLAHRGGRSESWADALRLRQIHRDTLEPRLSALGLELDDLLVGDGSDSQRAERLGSSLA